MLLGTGARAPLGQKFGKFDFSYPQACVLAGVVLRTLKQSWWEKMGCGNKFQKGEGPHPIFFNLLRLFQKKCSTNTSKF